MKFENRGKWLKEAEDKLAAYDTQEHPDFLDGDDKVCTFEDDEVANFEEDDLDIVEEDDTLDSPEDEEMDLAMEAAMPPMGQRKRIEFEDDIVKVYDGNKEIYAGAEDYEPMQDEDWKWDNANKYYKFDKYIKVCCESSQKNEDNASELKKELDYLYKGIGWSEWDYFKEGLAYSTNFKPNGMSDNDLEKMINASGIAKVKKVKEIRNYSSMEDFDPKDFKPDDKIIVTKKPMSSQFHGESSQKNEGKVTAQKFKNWPKRSQVKTAIDRVDDKLFNKLMNEFCLNVAKGDYFPQTIIKNGKLLFALTDEPITLDSIEKYFIEDEYLFESSQKNEGSNWEYSVSVLDNYGDIQYSTDCKSQSDIDNAIKKYKARSVELRNADNCTTIEITKDLVDDDGNILKSQSIKKMSL